MKAKTKKSNPGWHTSHLPSATAYPGRLSLGLLTAIVASGCVGPRPLKGGKATTAPGHAGVVEQTLTQGDNPAQPSRQRQESIRVRNYILPAGARVDETKIEARVGNPITNLQTIALSAPMPVSEREEIRTEAELGAAQKDTARELGTRLASLRGVTWLGVGLFLFGLASLVWPPLRLIIGSVTTSAAILAGGLALMILPTLIAGNELLILGGVGLTGGAWFLAHRHGQLRGQLSLAPTQPGTPPPPLPVSSTKS